MFIVVLNVHAYRVRTVHVIHIMSCLCSALVDCKAAWNWVVVVCTFRTTTFRLAALCNCITMLCCVDLQQQYSLARIASHQLRLTCFSSRVSYLRHCSAPINVVFAISSCYQRCTRSLMPRVYCAGHTGSLACTMSSASKQLHGRVNHSYSSASSQAVGTLQCPLPSTEDCI